MHVENTRLFEYYLRILAIKLGDNPIWYRMLCTISRYLSWLVNIQRRCHHLKKIYNCCANCIGVFIMWCSTWEEKLQRPLRLICLYTFQFKFDDQWALKKMVLKSNNVSIMKWLQKSTWKEHVWSTFIHRGYSDDVTESEPKGNVT